MPPTVTYGWARGSRMRGNPTAVAEELDEIRRDHGEVTAPLVVERARPDDSAMHLDIFNCDDQTAVEKYRESRARALMASLVVRVEIVRDEQFEEAETRAMVVVDENARGPSNYERTIDVMDNDLFWRRYLRNIEQDIQRIIDKYDKVSEFRDIVQGLCDVREQVRRRG